VAAKHRDRYQSRKNGEPTPPQVPTICRCCGRTLPLRAWRAGDEVGRWCDRPNCRADRNRVRSEIFSAEKADQAAKIKHLETVIHFLSDTIMADWDGHFGANRITCPECHNVDAIDGWAHPLPRKPGEPAKPCRGTLNGYEARNIGVEGLIGAWPTLPRFDIPK